jgi:2-hydroxy-3-keto-5-methylthiopentenyl-1-phosphate phosphatase
VEENLEGNLVNHVFNNEESLENQDHYRALRKLSANEGEGLKGENSVRDEKMPMDRQGKSKINSNLHSNLDESLHLQYMDIDLYEERHDFYSFISDKMISKQRYIQKEKYIEKLVDFDDLNDGDIYFMSQKAVGTDWKRKIIPTLRHAAGAKKYLITKI